MTPLRLLLVWTIVGIVGIAAVVGGWRAPRPGLRRSIDRLRRPAIVEPTGAGGSWPRVVADRLGSGVIDLTAGRFSVVPDRVDLALIGRTAERQAALLVAATLAGAAIVPVLAWGLVWVGVLGSGSMVAAGVVAVVSSVLGPLLVHTATIERAATIRRDLRHQLSAYLDVVTMLLAGNTGHEGALQSAATAGDGRLFVELRRRMREAATSGRSLVAALDATGADLGLAELRQVAATAALSSTEGAPVARTLTATCATLRSTLATEQETDARLRTSRLTSPLVGMALIFMALVIYPALAAP